MSPWGRGLLGQKGFGAVSESEIFEKVRILPKDFSSLLDAGNALETNPNHLPSLHKFAAFYQEQKLYWLGNEYYRQLIQIESDPAQRESILLNLAFNQIRLGQPGNAIPRFESLQKEYPGSGQKDLYLYGLIMANAKNNERSSAQISFAKLKKEFPKSQYIAMAEGLLQP